MDVTRLKIDIDPGEWGIVDHEIWNLTFDGLPE